MGKSYKKHPAASTITYNGSKRRANKRVRRLLKNPEIEFRNREYKKAYCSWEIRDYMEIADSFETFYKKQLEYWRRRMFSRWFKKEDPPTREECRQLYDRWYIRK